MSTRTPFVGGNWKMNTRLESGRSLAREVVAGCDGVADVEVAIFPPVAYILPIAGVLGKTDSRILLGAQDCSSEPDGAFTGEVSAGQLADCGVSVVIIGHSERRHVIGEDDDLINRKVRAGLGEGLTCMLCVGETLSQREAGETDAINEAQLRRGLEGVGPGEVERLIIAYEPVWAIGTGRTATPEDAQDAHAKIRGVLADLFSGDAAAAIRILYGGSVKPSNAAELFAQPDIDGGLIGGASLNAQDFLAIIDAARGIKKGGGGA